MIKNRDKFYNFEEEIIALSYQEKQLYLKVLNHEDEHDVLLMKLENTKNLFINTIDLNNLDTLELVKLYHALIYEQLKTSSCNQLKKEVYIENIKHFLKKNTFNIPYYFKYLDFDKFSFYEIREFFLKFFWDRDLIIKALETKDEFYLKYINFNLMLDEDLEEFFIQTDSIILYNWVKIITEWSNKYNLELPENKKDLLSLKIITANDKKLKDIPKEIGRLQSLIEINFSNINISIFDDNAIEEIPKEIYNLPLLEKLNISNNKVKVLPSGISKLSNLVELDISNNLLEELPIEISQLTNLKAFYFAENKLSSVSKSLFSKKIISIPKEFMNLEKLTILDNTDDCRESNENISDFFIRKNYLLN